MDPGRTKRAGKVAVRNQHVLVQHNSRDGNHATANADYDYLGTPRYTQGVNCRVHPPTNVRCDFAEVPNFQAAANEEAAAEEQAPDVNE